MRLQASLSYLTPLLISKGEPIVNTPEEAFNSFNASGMDLLVLGNYIVDKSKLES